MSGVGGPLNTHKKSTKGNLQFLLTFDKKWKEKQLQLQQLQYLLLIIKTPLRMLGVVGDRAGTKFLALTHFRVCEHDR